MNLPSRDANATGAQQERTPPPEPAWQPPVQSAPAGQGQPDSNGQSTLPLPAPEQKQQVFIPNPQAKIDSPDAGSQPAFRLSATPLNEKAVEAQALLAQQTDSQLLGGQAVRPLGNAPLSGPDRSDRSDATGAYAAMGAVKPALTDTQYTPSAQEAATGAYSADKGQQQPTAESSKQAPPPATRPLPARPAQQPALATTRKQRTTKTRSTSGQQSVPTLVTAPTEEAPPAGVADQQTAPQQPQAPVESPTEGGLTDEQLQDRNLPPLRGPWVRVQRQPRAVSPREEAEQQLQSLESSYSGWVGGAGLLNYRSGDLGYSRLAALEAPFELSVPLGYAGRFTFVARPVFLDSGQADGTSVITVQEATTSGRTLVSIPQPLGTDTNTGPTATGTFTGTPPAQQNAAGIGGEVQFTTATFGIAAGYTPFGFLVANWTARAQWRPGNGPFTFAFNRDPVKDSQLSYGGLRDPGTASLSYPGTIWGGVIANQGNMQYAHGDPISGFYVGVGGQYLTGYNVENNWRVEGNGGAYWRVKAYPERGNLSVGANFFAMHYNNNQGAFTFGMGGYFSPQAYFLANIPITWAGHSGTRWHYQIVGGLGVQAFQQDLTPLFPLASQKATEIAMNNASLPAMTSVGANYDIRANVAYQISPHWYADGFVGGNNARNYNSASVGFGIHYIFRSQPSTATGPTGMFSHEGLRPFTVP